MFARFPLEIALELSHLERRRPALPDRRSRSLPAAASSAGLSASPRGSSRSRRAGPALGQRTHETPLAWRAPGPRSEARSPYEPTSIGGTLYELTIDDHVRCLETPASVRQSLRPIDRRHDARATLLAQWPVTCPNIHRDFSGGRSGALEGGLSPCCWSRTHQRDVSPREQNGPRCGPLCDPPSVPTEERPE